MGLRFLADQCVPATVTTSLRNVGYEVLCLRDFLSIESPDFIPDVEHYKGNLFLVEAHRIRIRQ